MSCPLPDELAQRGVHQTRGRAPGKHGPGFEQTQQCVRAHMPSNSASFRPSTVPPCACQRVHRNGPVSASACTLTNARANSTVRSRDRGRSSFSRALISRPFAMIKLAQSTRPSQKFLVSQQLAPGCSAEMFWPGKVIRQILSGCSSVGTVSLDRRASRSVCGSIHGGGTDGPGNGTGCALPASCCPHFHQPKRQPARAVSEMMPPHQRARSS